MTVNHSYGLFAPCLYIIGNGYIRFSTFGTVFYEFMQRTWHAIARKSNSGFRFDTLSRYCGTAGSFIWETKTAR
jgi:hypothetical protein